MYALLPVRCESLLAELPLLLLSLILQCYCIIYYKALLSHTLTFQTITSMYHCIVNIEQVCIISREPNNN